MIEGPDQAIEDLFLKIRVDLRHKGITDVVDRPIEQREFKESCMGFKNLDQMAVDIIPGFEEFANPFSNEAFRKDTNRAHQLLLYFAKTG